MHANVNFYCAFFYPVKHIHRIRVLFNVYKDQSFMDLKKRYTFALFYINITTGQKL